jgi:hypothetical protein
VSTPIFGIEELPASSSQPEVYINTALRIMEMMAQLVIVDRGLTTPPGSPADGDVYYIGGSGSGAWNGHVNQLALYVGTTWHFITPRTGWIAWIEDENDHFRYEADSPPTWTAL